MQALGIALVLLVIGLLWVAAVLFGRADGHASLVAVVDLLENIVTQVVPAEQW